MKTYTIDNENIQICGLTHIDHAAKQYYRLPLDVIDNVSENVSNLARQSSGGRLRFRTDSKMLKISYTTNNKDKHGLLAGTAAFAMVAPYINGMFHGHLTGNCIVEDHYEWESKEGEIKEGINEIDLYLPMQNSIEDFEIMLDDDAQLLPPRPYTYEKPIVFYGSSITQGIAASHAGLNYVDRTCRALDSDYINLGFSGSCLAEESIGDYIASMDMSIFVYDYDHNAPTVEHIEKTHYKLYKKVREAHPDLPIVMITKPNNRYWMATDTGTSAVVKKDYERGIAEGDKNLYFIDGKTFLGYESHDPLGRPDPNDFFECTADGLHPNDVGMYRMSCVVAPVLKKILEK